MTSFFPDVNLWLALNDDGHASAPSAWRWIHAQPLSVRLIFSRYTQLGLLRLLTNQTVMGPKTLTLGLAWQAYDRWAVDPRVRLLEEPEGLDRTFRLVTAPFADKPASKWIGDCYLLAFASASHSTLVTFDRALAELATRQACPVVIPS